MSTNAVLDVINNEKLRRDMEQKTRKDAEARLEVLPARFLEVCDKVLRPAFAEIAAVMKQNGVDVSIEFTEKIANNCDWWPDLTLTFLDQRQSNKWDGRGCVKIGVTRSQNAVYFHAEAARYLYAWRTRQILQPEEISVELVQTFCAQALQKHIETATGDKNQLIR